MSLGRPWQPQAETRDRSVAGAFAVFEPIRRTVRGQPQHFWAAPLHACESNAARVCIGAIVSSPRFCLSGRLEGIP